MRFRIWSGGCFIVLALLGCSPNHENAPVDPLDMPRSTTSNDALYCGQGLCENADRYVQDATVSAPHLFDAWLSVIAEAPRTRVVASDRERGLIHAEQRSLVFRFVDTVLIRVVAQDEGSSHIVLSRSEMGSSDFGVNAMRLETWTGQLTALLGGSSK